ncbi:MAG: TatD family hydrolase [Actinomycetota bacterium]
MWFDSHCHLDRLDDPAEKVLERAGAAGVEGVITIGTDLPSSARAIEYANRHSRVWATVGVHPHDAESFDSSTSGEVERLASSGKVVAIGEVGMDFFRDHAQPAVQQAAFAAQIDIAKRLGLPLVMHIREAFDAAVQVLEEVGPPDTLIFHCFSGDRIQAARALQMGGFVSFAGNVSFKSAQNLRDAAATVPADRLLVETDSPYLAPVPYRGKPNEPSYLPMVGAAVAQAVGKPVQSVADATVRNTVRAFGLPAELSGANARRYPL